MDRAIHRFYVVLLVTAATSAPGNIKLIDRTESSGISFEHQNGASGSLFLPEIMGSGVALVDLDGDGKLDLWFVQSGNLEDDKQYCDAIYRNTTTKDGNLRFVDVTEETGICAAGYGMGIATGDIDNDQDIDILLTNFGPNELWINDGQWQFEKSSIGSVITRDDWSVSATFTDINQDNLLDLYIANYVDFTISSHKQCKDNYGSPSYCSPVVYSPTRDRLYINKGNGNFFDASDKYGVHRVSAAGLGVVARDFDRDGDQDVIVANDMNDNILWENNKSEQFSNKSLFSGIAVNSDANVEAGMGVIAKDFDADCDIDVFMTHLDAQTNTLYVNNGQALFTDRTSQLGLAASSLSYTGFGAGWIDLDNDSDLDLVSVNGAVTTLLGKKRENDSIPYSQKNQIWVNDGVRFEEITPLYFSAKEVSRGAAFGDFDNDGDIDIVITNNNGKARVYENVTEPRAWIGIIPSRTTGPTESTQVRLVNPMTACRMQTVQSDGSYASSMDSRIVFGLGSDTEKQTIKIHWPDGSTSSHPGLTTNQYHTIKQPVVALPPLP